jgi:hypothetical protein
MYVHGELQLTGSIAPNVAAAPTLLATINFSQFTASTTTYQTVISLLRRNAKQRTFIITNSMNQPITTVTLFFNDSASSVGSNKVVNITLTAPVANGQTVETSESKPILVSHVDSVLIGLAMGATAPTSGEVKIYVVEVL